MVRDSIASRTAQVCEGVQVTILAKLLFLSLAIGAAGYAFCLLLAWWQVKCDAKSRAP